MESNKFEILLVPPGLVGTKKLQLSPIAMKAIVLVAIGFILVVLPLIGFIVVDYARMRSAVGQLHAEKTHFDDKARAHGFQIRYFEQKLDLLETQLLKIQEMSYKLLTIAEIAPEERSEQLIGVGGASTAEEKPSFLLEHSAGSRIRRLHKEIARLELETKLQEKQFTELHAHLSSKRSYLQSIPSIWPTRGWLTSGFGYRISPFTNTRHFHYGIDIAARKGSDVVTPADGRVRRIYRDKGFGVSITIDHGNRIVTKYGHLHKAHVKKGQRVSRGQVIASVGNTGRSTGPHLHYEVRVRDVPTNPMNYILD